MLQPNQFVRFRLTLGLWLIKRSIMPRLMRAQYRGANYHLMSCSDRQEAIVLEDVDRQDFLKKERQQQTALVAEREPRAPQGRAGGGWCA